MCRCENERCFGWSWIPPGGFQAILEGQGKRQTEQEPTANVCMVVEPGKDGRWMGPTTKSTAQGHDSALPTKGPSMSHTAIWVLFIHTCTDLEPE